MIEPLQKSQGFALLNVLLVLTFLMFLGFITLHLAMNSYKNSTANVRAMQVLYIAEGGLEYTQQKLRQQFLEYPLIETFYDLEFEQWAEEFNLQTGEVKVQIQGNVISKKQMEVTVEANANQIRKVIKARFLLYRKDLPKESWTHWRMDEYHESDV